MSERFTQPQTESDPVRVVIHPAANAVEYYPPGDTKPARTVRYEQTYGRRTDAYHVGLGLWVLKNAKPEPRESMLHLI